MAKFSVGEKIQDFKEVVRTDTTTNRVKKFIVEGAPKFPSAAGQYLLDKVPIVQWLPHYHPAWLLNDFIAGLTIGVMLIPQGLAYAKIATIPIENGLYSSWLPAAFYIFMGTSKDLSSGPTSMLGLLTSEVVSDLQKEYSPTAIASAVAFMVGVYSLCMGVLGLGFLLDFVSVPVLTGFISATAIYIGMGQVESLVGLSNGPSMTFPIIRDALQRLPHWDGPTCGIGIGTLVILIALEQVGKRWAKRHFVIRYIASSRAVIVMILFTLISYLVNKDRGSKPLWALAQVNTHGIIPPKAPDTALLSKVAGRSIAPLIACTLEHLAVGKAFGRRNGYTIDQSQELNFLGLTNLVNSFFSTMAVGGAMSRTAVNSECHVRSPLSGIITAPWILLTLYVFSPALYWLPKATLSAIVIMAVVHLFGPVSHFYQYWRISLADFIGSMLSFWLTLAISAEIGIGGGVAWSLVCTLWRYAFSKPSIYASTEYEGSEVPQYDMPRDNDRTEHSGIQVPSDTMIIRFNDSVFYPNAYRAKHTMVEAIHLVYEKVGQRITDSRERSWSVATEKKIERLRKQQSIILKESPLSLVVWDMSNVQFIDVTAVLSLAEMKEDIRLYSGKGVQFRIVGLSPSVRERLLRAKWKLGDLDREVEDEADVVCPSVERAVLDRRGSIMEGVTIETEKIENEKSD